MTAKIITWEQFQMVADCEHCLYADAHKCSSYNYLPQKCNLFENLPDSPDCVLIGEAAEEFQRRLDEDAMSSYGMVDKIAERVK